MAATATAQSLDRASASWNSRTTLSALMDVGECSGTLTAARAGGRAGRSGWAAGTAAVAVRAAGFKRAPLHTAAGPVAPVNACLLTWC